MDAQSEVGHFLDKLIVWREESHREFSNVLQFHSSSINKGISNLVEEVNDLQVKLSVITKERNDLLETVHNLSDDIRKRSALSSPQAFPGPDEIHTTDVPETGDPDGIHTSESTDLDIVESVSDKDLTVNNDKEENYWQEEKVGMKEMHNDSTPSKSLEFESKSSNNIVPSWN